MTCYNTARLTRRLSETRNELCDKLRATNLQLNTTDLRLSTVDVRLSQQIRTHDAELAINSERIRYLGNVVNLCIGAGTTFLLATVFFKVKDMYRNRKAEINQPSPQKVVRPRDIPEKYTPPTNGTSRTMNQAEFQAYLERNINCFDPTLVLKAIDLKPSNFRLLRCETATCSIMRRAFELDIGNIKHLFDMSPDSMYVMSYSDVKDALEHAVNIHGFRQVSDIIKPKKSFGSVKNAWDDIVSSNTE